MAYAIGESTIIDNLGDEYDAAWDQGEIEAVAESLPDDIGEHVPFEKGEITACLMLLGDGEYLEIWATFFSRPYELGTEFWRVL